MHYLDKQQLDENILELVIYIHNILGDTDESSIQVSSIQTCKYISPSILQKVLMVPEYFINVRDYERERWLLVTLKETDDCLLTVLSVENVTETKNEFHRLH